MDIPRLVRDTLLEIRRKEQLRRRRTTRKSKERMSAEIDLLRQLLQTICHGDPLLCRCVDLKKKPLECSACSGDGIQWPPE